MFGSILLVATLLLLPTTPVRAAGVVGNGTAASCSETALRQALAASDQISFNCGPNPVTITLSEELYFRDRTVTIDGGGPVQGGQVALSGNRKVRVLMFDYGKLTIRNLTIRDGYAEQGAGIYPRLHSELYVSNSRFLNNDGTVNQREGGGGAIHVRSGKLVIDNSYFAGNVGINGGAINGLKSPIRITNSVFVANDASPGSRPVPGFAGNFGFGGAIYTDGTRDREETSVGGEIYIAGCVFRDNITAGQGGAVFTWVYDPDYVTIDQVLFEDNQALRTTNGRGGLGGALRHGGGNLTVSNSTFSDNTAGRQGGAFWYGDGPTYDIRFRNVTFVDNQADGLDDQANGGAMYASGGDVQIENATFADNYAYYAGGAIFGNADNITMRNSIIADNTVGNRNSRNQQCTSPLQGGWNIQSRSISDRGDFECTPGITIADPRIGSLRDFGGFTPTVPLLTGSPAIDAGNNCGLSSDQRGAARVGPCDIGAFEFGGTPAESTIPIDAPNLRAINGTDDPVVRATWDSVQGAVRYELQYAARNRLQAGSAALHIANAEGKLVLMPGSYEIRVRACTILGCGPYSTTRSITVKNTPRTIHLPLLSTAAD
jgi:hypothetical protein